MSSQQNKLLAFATIVLALIFPFENVNATLPSQTTPSDYSIVTEGIGVALYQKNNSSLNFVQVADLSQGASVKLLHGRISNPGAGNGVYGGNNPTFVRQTISDIWNGISSSTDAFCVTNGQFFSTNDNPTPLAFPIKKDGVIISDGYGIDEFPNQKLILELWDDRADIVPLTKESLYQSSAPNIIAGLTDDADKGINKLDYRTFVGIIDRNKDGEYETVLIFTSSSAKQADASQTLRNFGADKIMMLDGGGSTQFACKDVTYIPSRDSRTVPQTIAIFGKTVHPLAITILKQPNFPVIVEGETLSIEIEIKNTGSEIWKANEYFLVNIQNSWGADAKLPVPKNIQFGETVIFSWKTDKFSSWGIHSTVWQLAKGDDKFGDKITVNVIVLPKQLSDKKKELEEQVKKWMDEQVENIQELILTWIQEQIKKSLEEASKRLCSSVAILPLIVVGIWSRSHYRRKGQ